MLRFCFGLFLVLLPVTVHAEALDDASIRALYAEESSFGDEHKKEAAFMTKRLDDGFIVSSQITESDDGAAPETHIDKDTKAGLIEHTTSDDIKLDSHPSPYNISSIQYAPDHSYAMVTYTDTDKGTMSDRETVMRANYESAESCVERVQVVGGLLKIMHAACNTTLSITTVK